MPYCRWRLGEAVNLKESLKLSLDVRMQRLTFSAILQDQLQAGKDVASLCEVSSLEIPSLLLTEALICKIAMCGLVPTPQ